MDRNFYIELAHNSIEGRIPDLDICQKILCDTDVELLALLDAAFQVRKRFTGTEVSVHIINNVQNGFCPEDCSYCAQSGTSNADIDKYSTKSDEEILKEARLAYESGAARYCLVYSGRAPSRKRIEDIAHIVREIKTRFPLEVCVSPGLMDKEDIKILKDAGLDRLNHNLNTSENFYPHICTSHTYRDRLTTLKKARQVGLEVCSGIIAGMGESPKDIILAAHELASLGAASIPVNFLVPIKGNALKVPHGLTPEYCLRVLCLFRFVNPRADIRAAAGRELHLRSMEVLSLYPANSLFMDGYLNTKGSSRTHLLRMIKDAGFTIKSDLGIDKLLEQDSRDTSVFQIYENSSGMKTSRDLRPSLS